MDGAESMSSGSQQVASWINALAALSNKYEVKTLIPGHGPVGDQKTLTTMKDYFVLIGDSIGNKEKQTALKEKYINYITIPGMFSFNNTLKFIEHEKSSKKDQTDSFSDLTT